MKRRYFFFRHGRSEANEDGKIASRISGRRRDPGLTKQGVIQVRQAAQKLRMSDELRDVAIVSSPFRRATETSVELSRVFATEHQVDWRIRERDFGIYESMSDEHYEAVWENDRDNLRSDHFLVEPVVSVVLRVSQLLIELDEEPADRPVILVSHGDVISICWSYFAGLDLALHREFGAIETGTAREIVFSPAIEIDNYRHKHFLSKLQ